MDEVLAPGTRLGPYEITALLGSGGMGHVYRASDPRLSRQVAIKTLSSSVAADADVVQRFETEARTVGSLDHPNLLVVFDVGRREDVPFLVSELLEGETLRERLRRDRTLAPRQAIELAQQVVRGLAAAHERGIVHRDLKPENLFLTRDRRVKILDFGIAKRVAVPGAPTAPGAEALTAAGAIIGTVGYMAPEQVLGERVDARADIFALGVVLHELLAGEAPFRRDTAVATLSAIVSAEPPELPASVPPLLARIVRRCLEKAREDRFHSAHDLGVTLELLDSVSSGPAGTTPSRATGLSRRQAIGYGVASVALLAAGSAAGVLISDGRDSAVAPSFRRITFRRGLIRSARVAPDGQTIVFGALWDGESCRVHTARIDGTESGALDLPDASILAVSRSGELAIALGGHSEGVITSGTLARVPMSGGAPREVVERVRFADWSPDGTELAIVRQMDVRHRLEYPVGTVLLQPADGDHTGLGFARISPDGRRVAVVEYRTPDSLMGRVAVVDRSGTVTRLTGDYLNIHGLAWRGDEICFTAADDRPLFRALCTVSPGSGVRMITRMPGNMTLWDALPDGRLLIAQTDDRAVLATRLAGEANERDLSWLDASWIADLSRDGRQLLFTETGQGGGASATAYLRSTDGSPAIRLGAGQAYALSPDARWAICAPSATLMGVPASHLEVVPTGAGESRRIEGNGLGYLGARWLPEGDRAVVLARESGRRQRLFLLDLRQGRPQPITPEGVVDWVLSPDGSTVATTGSSAGIVVHPVDGSTSRVLPGTTASQRVLGWIHDGLLIADAGAPGASPGELRLMDARTGRHAPWASILPQDRAGIMALVSFCVTPDGRSRAYTWHRALSNLYVAEGLA